MAYRKEPLAPKPTALKREQGDVLVATGSPQTERGFVSHPTLQGHVESVQRVVDTLSGMLKRKQLGKREYQAADHYRTAFATLGGAMGGAMDFDRARGGSTPGSPPGPHMLIASDTVDQVKAMLYPKDYAVVYRVCALGMSIEETTEQLYGKPSTRSQRDDCSGRLRASLEAMADRWFPIRGGAGEGGSKIRSHVTERPMATDVETVPMGKAVHATGDKVFRSGRS